MKYKIITIPALNPVRAEDELNAFLSSHRVVSVEKQFMQAEGTGFWSFAVNYIDSSGKVNAAKQWSVDYKEVLSEGDFQKYAKLRDLRNSTAKAEGKTAYAIFTNEQLARLVTGKVTNLNEMAAIDGIGKARLDKYARGFLALLQQLHGSETA